MSLVYLKLKMIMGSSGIPFCDEKAILIQLK